MSLKLLRTGLRNQVFGGAGADWFVCCCFIQGCRVPPTADHARSGRLLPQRATDGSLLRLSARRTMTVFVACHAGAGMHAARLESAYRTGDAPAALRSLSLLCCRALCAAIADVRHAIIVQHRCA